MTSSDHVAASDIVLVAVDVDLFVKKIQHLTGLFDSLDLFDRSINVLDIKYDSPALEYPWKELQHQLLIGDLVKIKFILCDSKQAFPCNKFAFGQKVSGERDRKTE